MIKNILKSGLVLLLMFSFASLVSCETFNLSEYKVEASKELDNYVDSKGNEFLSYLEVILIDVANSKKTINDATSKSSVDIAVAKAKEAIDKMVEEKTEIVTQVKQSYLDTFIKINRQNATIDDVVIMSYLGTYNGNFVAVLYDKQNCIFKEPVIPYKVNGLNFDYSYGYPILVWKNGEFSLLHEAFAQDEFTESNLDTIYYLYRNKQTH